MAQTDELGARMKGYESAAETRLDISLPICARIDGRRFSRFTRGFQRPFDPAISCAMRAACAHMVEHTHALIGYVQSDEISLVWQAGEGSGMFFEGRVQKMASVLAGMTTAAFLREMVGTDPEVAWARLPSFDARAWQVPNRIEAANVILWRAADARKNGILSAARAEFSPRAMHGKRQPDLLVMLADKGTDYASAYRAEDRLGVFCRRVTRERDLTDAEWHAIPEPYRPETRRVLRSSVEQVPMPYFGDVANRVEVIFEEADPQPHPARDVD